MNKIYFRSVISGMLLVVLISNLSAQTPPNFFLDSWEPRILTVPAYNDVAQTTKDVNVSVKISFNDTITKVSKYLFGDNVNPYTYSMSDNKTLMKYMADRNMGVL